MRERARRRDEDDEQEQARVEGASATVEHGPEAASTAARFGARAVTIGNRVLLGPDVRPGDAAGRATLRHEQLHAQQVALGRSTGRAAPASEVEAQAARAERGEDVAELLPADPARPHLQGGGLLEQLGSLAGIDTSPDAAQAALEEKATEALVGLVEKRVPHGKLLVAAGKVGNAFVEGIGQGMDAARARLSSQQQSTGYDFSGTTMTDEEAQERFDREMDATRGWQRDAVAELPGIVRTGAVTAAREALSLVQAEVEGWIGGQLEDLAGPLSEQLGDLANAVVAGVIGENELVEAAVDRAADEAVGRAREAANQALVTAVTEPGFEWAETQLDTAAQLAAPEDEGGAGMSAQRAAELSEALAAQMPPSVVAESVQQKVDRIRANDYRSELTDSRLSESDREEFETEIAVALMWLERAAELRAEIDEGLSFGESAFEVGADVLGAVGLDSAAAAVPQVGTTQWQSLKDAADHAWSSLLAARYAAPVGHDFEGEMAALERIADEARRNAD